MPDLDRVQRQVTNLGPGQPLPSSERSFFEPRFGMDFGAVRLHTGSQAAAAAQLVSARAFALGGDLVFGAGEYRLGSREGRRLIAHELTHTLQQGAVQQGTVRRGSIHQGAMQRETAPEAEPRQRETYGQEGMATGANLESPEILELSQSYRGSGLEQRLQRQEEEEESTQGGGSFTMHSSCAGQEALIREAWNEARIAVADTIHTLRRAQLNALEPGGVRGVSCGMAESIRASFGRYAGYDQQASYTRELTLLRDNYSRLLSALEQGGRTIRCDAEQVLMQQLGSTRFCRAHDAFVSEEPAGFENDIFFCRNFFNSNDHPCGALRGRAKTIVHEYAHNVLNIEHQGGRRPAEDCSDRIGLPFEDALHNTHAYDHLATCCGPTGECGEVLTGGERVVGNAGSSAEEANEDDSRGSVSLSGGVAVQDGEVRGALALGTQVGLRSGQALIFQPTFGFHLLTTFDGAGDDVLGAALADFGFRLQQPMEGVYFDLAAGGYTGFRVQPDPATGDRDTDFSAGLQGGGGLGYRWERVELGAEARGLIPLTGDPAQLLVLGRVALRF
ncbi:MAG: DUF4157 domain-containing protein [Acidobacteriota bacterium]